MARHFLLAFLVVGIAAAQWTSDPELRRVAEAKKPVDPKRATVNLDLPPQERWAFLKSDPAYANFKADFTAYVGQYIPKWVLPLVTTITGTLRKSFAAEYADEMVGIASALDLTVGDVVLINLIYQVEQLGDTCEARNTTGPCPPKVKGPGMCTGVVAQDAQGAGTPMQGRNLDWNLNANLLQYVIQVDYQKAGKTLFTGVQIAGMVGALHGVKAGAFSIQMNARADGGEILLNLLDKVILGYPTPSHILRGVLEESADFDAAQKLLQSTKLANPVYYIVAGAKRDQGAIITRDRLGNMDAWHLNEESPKDKAKLNPQAGWFRLQTNYDHWTAVPSYDDRRTPGVANMGKVCNGTVTEQCLHQVMTTWPTFNPHTDVTSLMTPSTGAISTVVWLPAAHADVVVV